MLQMVKKERLSLSPHAVLYDILIEKENFWRQLNESIDFSFIFDEVREKYSESMGDQQKTLSLCLNTFYLNPSLNYLIVI